MFYTLVDIILKNILVIHHKSNYYTSSHVGPFDGENYLKGYSYFASLGSNLGLDIFIANYKEMTSFDSVKCWRFFDGEWKRSSLSRVDAVYDKCQVVTEKMIYLRRALSEKNIPTLNTPEFTDICHDKFKTCQFLGEYAIPTIIYSGNIMTDINRLNNLPHQLKNNSNLFFAKPRFGWKGENAIVFSRERLPEFKKSVNYVIQPFFETSNGVTLNKLNIEGRHDMRIMIANGKLIQVCIKRPKRKGFISSYSHGGNMAYHFPKILPQRWKEFALTIDEKVKKFNPRLYSIDCGIDTNNELRVFELESTPGIHPRFLDDPTWQHRKFYQENIIKIMKILCE